jgi:hypothetical protein
MPNYSNGKIYTIRFHNSNEIYIGSTTQSLGVRFGEHKRRNNSAVYRLINDKYDGNWSLCYYELHENYSCNNKEELCRKEGEVILLFKNDENYDCINCRIECRTDKEYYIENIEKIKEKQKIYYENNIDKKKEYRIDNLDKIKEQKKQYYENNADKFKERNKQYREENANKLKEDKKLYYQKNKEKISIKLKEKINCDCGSCINKGDLSKHFKTKKHQDYLASLHQPQ